MTFQSSLFGRMINDIWYADPRNQHALASSLIGIGVLFIIVLIMLPVRTRIFKGLDEEPDIEDMDTIIVRLRKSGRIVIGIGLGFLAYLFVMSPLQVGGYFGSESSFGAFAPLFTFFLFRWMQRQYYNPSSHDETLTVRAKELALRTRQPESLRGVWKKASAGRIGCAIFTNFSTPSATVPHLRECCTNWRRCICDAFSMSKVKHPTNASPTSSAATRN
jgi:hypothetical protein